MSKKTSTSTSQVSIPPEVLERYTAVNKRAEEVAANPFQRYGETAEAFVAPINQQQLSGIANVNAAAGAYQPYFDRAALTFGEGLKSAQPGELNVNEYMNPFQQQVIDATLRQMGQANEQAQSGALGTAVSSGAFGGDRAGIAAANLANQQGMAMGSTLAGLNAQNYQQALAAAQQQQGLALGATQADLERLMRGGQFYAGLGTAAQTAGLQGAEAQINAGTLQQQTEQAGKTALVNQFMQEQGYPFQVAQFLANIAMGTGALSGSTTTTTQPAPFFSDRRLKEDVKRIGKTDDGLPIYSFKYKGDDAEQTHVGFMADEVEKVKPEAVGLHPSGYKTVDYAKATENSMGGGVVPRRAGQGFAGGGVAGPYGASPGSQVDFGGYVPQAFLPVGELMMADPAIIDAARQSMAQQLATIANIGDKVRSLDETWQWAKDRWGGEGREDELMNAEAGRGVTYASGGAAYLRSQPPGGLMPNSARSYLSDTLESQDKGDKPELKTASGNGGGSGKSPAENIADLGKMAMMFLGFQNGGRAGYRNGGPPEEETIGEKVSRLTAPARYAVTDRIPNSAMALGSLGLAAVQGAAGLGLGAINQPEASDYMLDAAGNSMRRSTFFDRAANAPMPESLSSEEIRALNAPLSPEQIAAREAGSNMTMAPPRFQGDTRDPLQPVPRAALGLDTEYGRMLRDPASALPPYQMTVGPNEVNPDDVPIPPPGPQQAPGLGVRLYRNEPPLMPDRAASDMPVLPPGPQLAPSQGVRLYRNEPPLMPDRVLVPAAGTPLAPSGGLVPAAGTPTATSGGLGAAAAAEAAVQPASFVSPVQPTGFTGVAGAGRGYTDVILPDGTVQRREGARNWRNNNPGNIEFGPFAEANGAIGSDGRFAVFPTYEAGRAAKEALLFSSEGYAGKTIAGALERYAPRSDNNNTEAYIATVASALGVDPNTPLAELSPAQRDAMLTAMERVEGGGAGGDGQFVSYSTSPGGLGGAGGSGAVGGDGNDRVGLGRALLTSDKPYKDRTTLGKMFYNEDGTVNRNALLSIASGIGGMLSSPSQFFLPSLGLGLQGAASTYAGLEKQAADIGLTKAEERRVQVEADKARIYEGSNGMLLINFGDGRPPVSLFDYMENPTAYSTGDRQLDAEILRQAQIAAANAPRAEGVFAVPAVQTLLERETENANRNPNAAVAQSAPIEAAINASASIARSSIPSILTQADAVSALTSPQAAVRAGALGPLKQNVANYLNDISQTLTQILGLPPDQALPTIGDPNGGDAAANAQEILKVAVETGMMNANGIQELQTIMAAQPNVALAAETNSALMAGLLVSGRADMRRADFMRDYKAQPSNTQRTAIDAGQAFQEVYGDQIIAEKAALKEIIHYGSQPMPPEWASILGDYKTPMEFLMTPGIPVEAKNEFIAKLLPALGVNEMVISALQGPDGMYIGNYFGG